MRKASKPSSSRPISIYFEFRSKPSLITVICMNPHSPDKLIATQYCVLILGDDTSFFFLTRFLNFSFFFVILCYFVIINFYKNCYYFYFILLIFFHENFFYFFMFQDVPACSGMFRVLGFIDALHESPACSDTSPISFVARGEGTST